jgi:branched-chain amino acid transport system permease protein
MTRIYQDNRRVLNAFIAVAVVVVIGFLMQERLAELRLNRMIQTTITGLLVGGVYALIALGIVIINKASGVFNFAHGYLMLFGGMLFYTFFSNSAVEALPAAALAVGTVFMALIMNGFRALRDPRSLAIGAVVVVVLTALMTLQGTEIRLFRAVVGGIVGAVFIGLLIERFTIRPLIGQPLFASVLMTLAIAEVLRGLINLIWGSVPIPLQIFSGLQSIGIPNSIRIQEEWIGGNVIIRSDLLVTFVLALLTFLGFVLFFRYTNVGLAMRASAENQPLAQSIGLRVRLILAVAWGITSVLAGTAGVLQGSASNLDLNMPFVAFNAFPAVLLGGLESVGGALAGGIIIGLVQDWGNYLFGNQAGTELAPYIALMIVLVIRPDGLFGEKRIERI